MEDDLPEFFWGRRVAQGTVHEKDRLLSFTYRLGLFESQGLTQHRFYVAPAIEPPHTFGLGPEWHNQRFRLGQPQAGREGAGKQEQPIEE